MKIVLRATTSFALMLASTGVASAAPSSSTIIPLYPKGTTTQLPVPEVQDAPQKNGDILVRNVSVPTLEVFRPAAGTANGTAVIVAPGGGFLALVYNNEGTSVAEKLARQGITAFVLKYRLVPTPEGMAEHGKQMEVLLARIKSAVPLELPRFNGEDLAVQDGSQAVKMVRDGAAKWGIDPKRIGFVGFSAGAFIAADVAIGDPASRPDFVGIIYGGLRTPVTADAPPAFIATAANDELLPNDPVLLYNAWKAAGRSAELHIYERGKHGFGTRTQGASSDHWFDEFVWWMQSRGIVKQAVVSSGK